MKRRNFLRVTGAGVIVAASVATVDLAGCSDDMPAEAIEAWQGPDSAVTADPDVRRWLLSYAILAPHSHNLQSWIVDLGRPNEIMLSCDLKRTLPQTDPLSRQIMMSHGTFLELLDLAARERGLRAEFELFPQGVFAADKLDTRPVARIRLTPDATRQKDPLFAQILRRHTNRSGYDGKRGVPSAAWQAMNAAVQPHALRFGHAGLDNTAALAAHRRIALAARR